MAAEPYEYTKNYSIVILLRDLYLNLKTAWVLKLNTILVAILQMN